MSTTSQKCAVVPRRAGSYLRLIDFVYHSTLGLRIIKKNKKDINLRKDLHGCLLDEALLYFPLELLHLIYICKYIYIYIYMYVYIYIYKCVYIHMDVST